MSETTPTTPEKTNEGASEPESDENPAAATMDQLRALAGAPAAANELVLRMPNAEIQVKYGALLSTIELRAPFPTWSGGASAAYRGHGRPVLDVKRPLAIYLRKEDESDRRHKARGINREVQTGDAEFDAEVYITALYDEDETVRAVLANERARRAAVALLGEKPNIFLLDDTDGSVLVDFVLLSSRKRDPERGRRIAEALDELVASLPALRTTGEHKGLFRGWMIMVTWAAALTPGAVLFSTMTPPRCRPTEGDMLLSCEGGPECCQPVAAGLAGGLVVAVAVGYVVWRTVRGKSNSSTRQKIWMILTTGLSLELGVLLARLLWPSSP